MLVLTWPGYWLLTCTTSHQEAVQGSCTWLVLLPTAPPPTAPQDIRYPFLVLIIACLLAVDLFYLLVVTAVPAARYERDRILLSVSAVCTGWTVCLSLLAVHCEVAVCSAVCVTLQH